MNMGIILFMVKRLHKIFCGLYLEGLSFMLKNREVIRGSTLHFSITRRLKKRSSAFYIPDYSVNLYASSLFKGKPLK
ncbi:MAG TPA: hypothetical protein DCL86_01845 [Bacteroidales bacterium]|nr:hypothetical protein [Bacteroidales bacterium]